MLTCWYRSNEGLLTELYKMRKGSRSACPSHNWRHKIVFIFLVLHWTFCTKPYMCGCSCRCYKPLGEATTASLMPWIYSMSSFVDLAKYLYCVKLSLVWLIIVGRMTWATPMVGFVCLFLNIALLLFLFKHLVILREGYVVGVSFALVWTV